MNLYESALKARKEFQTTQLSNPSTLSMSPIDARELAYESLTDKSEWPEVVKKIPLDQKTEGHVLFGIALTSDPEVRVGVLLIDGQAVQLRLEPEAD